MYKQTRFQPFVGLVVISSVGELNYKIFTYLPSVKFSQIFTARDHRIQRDSNFQREKECSFRQFIGFCKSAVDFSLLKKKLVSYISLRN